MRTRMIVLNQIVAYIKEHGYAPTIRELCVLTGLKSTSSVHSHVQNLIKEGKLETDHDFSNPRAIRVPGCKFVTSGELYQLQRYRVIGTVDECRGAVERQKPKTPNIWGDGYDENGNMIYDMYDCPCCGKSYEIDYDHYEYCPKCGQHMDKSNKVFE